MKLSLLSVLALGIGAALVVVPASAHHSFSAEYDSKKVVNLSGIVSNVEWMNPHVYFYIDVMGEDGKVANWACEMGPPNGLQRSGWTRNTMKIGDEITVNGTLAKDGSKQLNARTVTMTATGKRLGAASSEGKGN
ncbi:MAG: DUF6152 family protein [Acidobacteriota bacterium]